MIFRVEYKFTMFWINFVFITIKMKQLNLSASFKIFL